MLAPRHKHVPLGRNQTNRIKSLLGHAGPSHALTAAADESTGVEYDWPWRKRTRHRINRYSTTRSLSQSLGAGSVCRFDMSSCSYSRCVHTHTQHAGVSHSNVFIFSPESPTGSGARSADDNEAWSSDAAASAAGCEMLMSTEAFATRRPVASSSCFEARGWVAFDGQSGALYISVRRQGPQTSQGPK